MINVRLIKPGDTLRMRTQYTFKVENSKKLFEDSESTLAVYKLTLTSITSLKTYVVSYFEDGKCFDPYNYSKDITSFERK